MSLLTLTLDDEHGDLVVDLAKPGHEIAQEMSGRCADLIHGAMGVSGEAGELLDAIKKHTIYNKPLDIENIIEELGDLEFYMQMIRRNLGITREQTLQHNIAKLRKRYGEKYSDRAAQERADKQ